MLVTSHLQQPACDGSVQRVGAPPVSRVPAPLPGAGALCEGGVHHDAQGPGLIGGLLPRWPLPCCCQGPSGVGIQCVREAEGGGGKEKEEVGEEGGDEAKHWAEGVVALLHGALRDGCDSGPHRSCSCGDQSLLSGPGSCNKGCQLPQVHLLSLNGFAFATRLRQEQEVSIAVISW
jgi:hypothetical protein